MKMASPAGVGADRGQAIPSPLHSETLLEGSGRSAAACLLPGEVSPRRGARSHLSDRTARRPRGGHSEPAGQRAGGPTPPTAGSRGTGNKIGLGPRPSRASRALTWPAGFTLPTRTWKQPARVRIAGMLAFLFLSALCERGACGRMPGQEKTTFDHSTVGAWGRWCDSNSHGRSSDCVSVSQLINLSG